MRFSIIIPFHNAADRMRIALDSVKKQTFTDYELICVCDACEDNTVEIAREYTDNVLEVNFKNDGATRSAGLDIAKGEYVLFLDDDDYWMHEYVLQQIHDKLCESSSPDILCFSFIFRGWKYATPTGNQGRHWIAVWNKCWKRTAIGGTRFPALKHGDSYFHRDMFAKGLRIVDWDMPMYYYNYMRPGSLSWKYAGKE